MSKTTPNPRACRCGHNKKSHDAALDGRKCMAINPRTFAPCSCKSFRPPRERKPRDPLAGIPPELQAKMRDPAWREAFNAPLTPERAALAMPPVDVLALMLARWMNVSPTTRQWFVGVNRRCSAINEKHDYARAEGAAADLLEALDLVIAAATAQSGDGVKDGAR